MSPAKRVIPALTVLFAFFAVMLIWRMNVSNSADDSADSLATAPHAAKKAQTPNSTNSAPPKQSPSPPILFTPDELSVQELQDLLDDDNKHQEALAKALAMTKGSIREQIAAIDAFRWLGGRKAMEALIQLRNEAYALVADEAGNVLNHLLSESIYKGGIRRDDIPDDGIVLLDEGLYDDELKDDDQRPDAALWLDAIQQAPDDNAREALLIILSAYPVDQSVPILLQLFDSPDATVRDSAQEYLQSITGGEEILTREEGEEWLAKAIADASSTTDTTDSIQAPDAQ